MTTFNLSDAKLIKEVQGWFKEDKRHFTDMRRQMVEDYDFYAGQQWSTEDEAFLRENHRPIVTFNRVAPTIDSVTGSERSNRQEVRYLPRTLDDNNFAEMFTETGRWVRDRSDAEDEESEAFEDCVKVGVGCTETWVDFETELDGEIKITRVPPMELLWDHNAHQRNLADARRVYRVKMLTREQIKELWPGKRLRFGDTDFKLEQRTDPHIADNEVAYQQDFQKKNDEDEVPVVQVQWWERRPVFRAMNPVDGNIEVLTSSELAAAEEVMGEIESVRQTRKEYFQAFIVGDTLLDKRPLHESPEGIVPGFTLKFITGKRDETDGTWFGLMRAMRDPQLWSNKFFSQILDIINSNAKGGVFAETDAFANTRKAEEDYAKTDRILWVNPGALSQKKIEQRSMANFPTAIANMMQVAMSSVRDTSGVTVEQLGMASRTQSNVVEQSRIQQGLITLTVFFDSLRRYRKEQGRLLLHMMNIYIPDQTVVRVVGEDKFIPFEKNGQVPRFDIIVDQAPNVANQKQEIWAGLQQILPALIKVGLPIPPELLDYIPLPESAIAKFKKFYADQAKAQQEAGQKQAQQADQQFAAEIEKTKAEAINDIANAMSVLKARENDEESNRIDAVKVILESLTKLEEAGKDDATGSSGNE